MDTPYILGFNFTHPNCGFGVRMKCEWTEGTVEVFGLNTEPCQEKTFGHTKYSIEEFKKIFSEDNAPKGYNTVRHLILSNAKPLFDAEYYDFYSKDVIHGADTYVRFIKNEMPAMEFINYINENMAKFNERLKEQQELKKQTNIC